MIHKATLDSKLNARGVNRSGKVAKDEFDSNRKIGKHGSFSKEIRGLAQLGEADNNKQLS